MAKQDGSNDDQSRMARLEALCADVYVAGTELGLPEPLLRRLWHEIGQGRSPEAFHFDLPPRPNRAMPTGMAPQPTAIDRVDQKEKEQQPQKRPALQPLPERRTVLVVDDDPMMLELLVRILRRENYELIVATGGLEALSKSADQNRIDLMITDCEMPDLKGPEVAVRMRERFPKIKVLFQTGFSSMLFEERPELGDDEAFLEKPFTARGLAEAARLLLFGTVNPAT